MAQLVGKWLGHGQSFAACSDLPQTTLGVRSKPSFNGRGFPNSDSGTAYENRPQEARGNGLWVAESPEGVPCSALWLSVDELSELHRTFFSRFGHPFVSLMCKIIHYVLMKMPVPHRRDFCRRGHRAGRKEAHTTSGLRCHRSCRLCRNCARLGCCSAQAALRFGAGHWPHRW